MKYLTLALSVLLLLGLSSFGKPNDEGQLLPTKLRITVIDGLGNTTEGVTVAIYKDQDDYRTSTNPIATELSDDKGRVTFSDLEPIPYFIEASKGDMNNDGEGVRTEKLKEGRLNKVNTVVE